MTVLALIAVTSCNNLSKEAKEIVGSYIIPEVSQTEPVMELNKDATCVVRAIKPGVLTYSVKGTWNVKDDSLIMCLDSTTVAIDGDASMVGEIPLRSARKVVEHSDFNLQLEKDGIVYLYKRM